MPDPALIAFCKDLWRDDPVSAIRLILEPARLVPLAGLAGGGLADVLAATQDVLAVPAGDILHGEISGAELGCGGLVGLTILPRSALNIAGNAVGHLEAFPNVAVGSGLAATVGQAATIVGAPEAVGTGAATAGPAFPDEADKWWELGCGYLSNMAGDPLGWANDLVGLATAGASQPGEISQALIDKSVERSSAGEVASFGELMAQRDALPSRIDEAAEAVSARSGL